ncbi:YtxH domain-containing protein [Acidithiobacillus montserratensis]|uniref:YtxH domain-containing protein n=1 Tax=Acidithiobacillus montserratensis TaxID=2729135 RepID=A0ACD5HE05_9PROT|nr:YtxH domain-containing protein [Acidithiobacillus montserratensis]MBN2678924.1 YtxH domain-containing protein [Acidithiobacillaceae bacterium]MBU2747295.1 YtxH domain-containing protein [Acidithiobacillus montserratensis]
MRNAEGFVVGILVGAVGALLLAPASGAETRQEIRRAMDKGKERFYNLESLAEERIGVLIDEIQEKTARLMDAGGDLMESKREDLLEAIQVAKRALAEERDILTRSTRARREILLEEEEDA